MCPKTVLVVGGGVTGLISIATLKAEGMVPVCYERSDSYGGTWCYREEVKFGEASIMPTTIINNSKELGAISNFPPRKEFSNYMKHTEMYQYLTDYVKHNDCEKFIYYNMEVIHVRKADDYEDTGRWTATTKNLKNGKVITETFDGIFLGTGHVNMPSMPTFPGQEIFKGNILHTHSLKHVEEFTGQRVVIVGIGCSALDAAVEISRVAKQVYLSSRSGAYIWNRVGQDGYPVDFVLFRRYMAMLLNILPTDLLSWYVETFYHDVMFDHGFYYPKPKYHTLSRDPILNDFIHSKILSGSVIQKGDIVTFSENGAIFENENGITEVDIVIMATGYTWGFPYLEEGIIEKSDEVFHLYKTMYPIHLPHSTLAVLAFAYPFGPSFPVIELQVRWAVHNLAGKGALPAKDIMMRDVKKRFQANMKRYSPSEKMSIRVDIQEYSDNLASQIGAKPNLIKYLFTDFPLYINLMFGPLVSYQYRLEGHGKWEGAREAIMTVKERVQFPVTRGKPSKKGFIRYIIEYIFNIIPFKPWY